MKVFFFFGGDDEYAIQINRDLLKYDICKENGIDLFYFVDTKNYVPDVYIGEIYRDETLLLNKILNYEKKLSDID